MPSDDYTSVGGGGALKLKGAKVTKKKKKKDKSNLEKNLGASGKEVTQRESPSREKPDENEDEDPPESTKTESERRHDELRKKRLLELAESSNSGSGPGLLKTHKERVEELNTYLSKLSEHHDMPKIGPG